MSARRRVCAAGATLTVAVAALGGCVDGATSNDSRGKTATVRVFAASSLTEAFEEIAADFEERNDGVEVGLTFAGSSALAQQIKAGADVDVFVPADEETLQAVVDAGNAGDPTIVARNQLTILVEKGNPQQIASLSDLARPGLVVVVCAPGVPCGRLAGALLRAEGIDLTPASLEENVKGVVSKVTLGEADAGIVYATDARASAASADAVAVPAAASPALSAVYPATVTTRAADTALARRWIAHLLSPSSQATLERHGFLPA